MFPLSRNFLKFAAAERHSSPLPLLAPPPAPMNWSRI